MIVMGMLLLWLQDPWLRPNNGQNFTQSSGNPFVVLSKREWQVTCGPSDFCY